MFLASSAYMLKQADAINLYVNIIYVNVKSQEF